MTKHSWLPPTPVTVEAARCSVCSALDWDHCRVNEECPGVDAEDCPTCRRALDDERWCSCCGKRWPREQDEELKEWDATLGDGLEAA